MSLKRTDKKLLFNRILNYSLLALAAITVIFVASLFIKITNGVAKTVETPEQIIRLQLANGSSEITAIDEVEKFMNNYKDDKIDLLVVEKREFTKREIARSFIVSRTKDKTSAENLAKKLGLETDNITYKPLENNYNQVSVTLVLGNDYQDLLNIENKDKE